MDIQKFLQEDTKEKRQALSGVHGRTGKRGYVGTVRFPSDLMSRREKYNYRKAGKVVKFNVYDTIMLYEDFLNLDESSQKKTLEEYRNRFTNKEIQAHWGMDDYHYYQKTIKRLGIKTSRRGKTPKVSQKDKVNNMKESAIEQKANGKRGYSEMEVKGFSFTFNGDYSAEELVKRLEKVALLLSDENKKFSIKMSIQELDEQKEEGN
ncbi:hypothetical protein [Pseudobacillus badius]|uniref:hypothetical protein n=1 Tax=Bacillus badius TaxID=1455 RepID=UPI0007B3705F|nr:hypothetical protein [Bacillus badius]KZR57534.1 hypothetical protein A3781_19780 [Bacillus badius]